MNGIRVRDENKENSGRQNSVGTQSHSHGSIVQIRFYNFLTYNDTTCRPGPLLNVIIGANGTGKSSIMCGICLALGASPKVLGRSDSMGDYIKHGEETAFVELSIWDNLRKRPVVFKVNIVRPSSTQYFIDNQRKKREEIARAVCDFNIQIDNPCTFLAQDKVKSFAEQGIQKLLINTEKAGSREVNLLEKHEELIQISKEGKDYKSELENRERRLEFVDLDIRTKKSRVENFLDREKQHNVINLLKKKHTLILCREKHRKQISAESRVKEAKKQLEEHKSNRDPIDATISGLRAECDKLKGDSSTQARIQKELGPRIKETMGLLALHNRLQESADQLTQARNLHDNWDKTRRKLEEDHRQFKIMYEDAKAEYVPNSDLERKKAEFDALGNRLKTKENELTKKSMELQHQKSDLHLAESRSQEIMEAKLKNIARLARNTSILDAWKFYENNRNLFRFPVYVPFLHIHVPNQNDLIYINNIIATRDLSVFIFGCFEDQEKLLGKYRVNASIVDQDMISQLRMPTVLSDELRQMGFRAYLSQLFSAPPSVVTYLFSEISRVLIGERKIEENYEQVAARIGREYRTFMTDRFRYSIRFSRYGDDSYTQRVKMSTNFRLSGEHVQKNVAFGSNRDRIQKEMDRNAEEKATLGNEVKEFQNMKVDLQNLQKVESEKLTRIENYRQQINRISARLQEYSKQKPNIEAAKAAYDERKKQVAIEVTKDYEKLIELLEKRRNILCEAAVSMEEYDHIKNRIRNLYSKKEHFDEMIKAQTITHGEAVRRKNMIDEQFRDYCEEFAKLSGIPRIELIGMDGPEIKKLEEEFVEKNIPDDPDWIGVRILEEEKGLSGGRQEGTRKDVDEFEKLKLDKVRLHNEIEKLTKDKNSWAHQMDQKLSEWLDPLKLLVNQISQKFSEFFERLQCTGQVTLTQPEDKYDIDAYGITILVKFRHGNELRPLSAQTQSGGERSVSTMCYLMALFQDLCLVPFRCVDEINQGMDPDNERAIFNMMVTLLAAGDNPTKTQYFLLTPKLLTGLQFNDKVTVHVIHNGPAIENSQEWNANKTLQP